MRGFLYNFYAGKAPDDPASNDGMAYQKDQCALIEIFRNGLCQAFRIAACRSQDEVLFHPSLALLNHPPPSVLPITGGLRSNNDCLFSRNLSGTCVGGLRDATISKA